MKIFPIAIVWLCLCLELFAHGRSPEMIRELNAPVPEWMSITQPIPAAPVDESSLPASYSFRSRAGGATNSRNRVQIPERKMEFQVDYEIDYTGNNAAGTGVSLSPDGTKLIVNSGTAHHLYEITPKGEHREIPIQLPYVTYDPGPKGFITGWSWAGNDALVGCGEITDDAGDQTMESRLYLFRLKERTLSRIDLSALNLTKPSSIEISEVGSDLGTLRIRAGARKFLIKCDLKIPAPRDVSAENLKLVELEKSGSLVGMSRHDLTALLGDPTKVMNEGKTLVYRLDSGFGGLEWIFELQDEKIIKAARTDID